MRNFCVIWTASPTECYFVNFQITQYSFSANKFKFIMWFLKKIIEYRTTFIRILNRKFSSIKKNFYVKLLNSKPVLPCKATSVRGITLTLAHLGSILNFAVQASWAKFKKEPKCTAVKVMPLTEVAELLLKEKYGTQCKISFCKFSTTKTALHI